VLRVNRWRNVIILLVFSEGEQMEECDNTTSSNDETPSRVCDSEFDPNYLLSGDQYSYRSDINNSSLREGNVCALNGTKCVDLDTGKGKRKSNSRKKGNH